MTPVYRQGVEDAQRLLDLKLPQQSAVNQRKGGKPMPDPKREKKRQPMPHPDEPLPGEVEDFDDSFETPDDIEEDDINPT